jgi:hypothetical protein
MHSVRRRSRPDRLWLLVVLVALFAALAVACGDDDDEPEPTEPPPTETAEPSPTPSPTPVPSPTPTPEPSPEPTPAEPRAHPDGTTTGIEQVDAVIEAVTGGDTGTLAALLRFRGVPCTPQDQAEFEVTCPEGVAEGTPVEAFIYSGCHGDWIIPEQADVLTARLTGGLYAVYDGPAGSDAEWTVVFLGGDQPFPWSADVTSDGEIATVATGCAHSVEDFLRILVPGSQSEPVLAPVE